MKIISWNVNGIRAVERKGDLKNFLEKYAPDIFLMQEIKASPHQLAEIQEKYKDYTQFYNSAEKPGYAGTAIWMRKPLDKNLGFLTGFPGYQDTEGRICGADFNEFAVLNIYFPNGGKSHEAWLGKLVFYEKFLEYVDSLQKSGKQVIWGGDVNCAHEEIDIARPEANKNSIGFLPEERAWVDKTIKHGWIDVFRHQFPKKIQYSWWDVITRARERNVGWRLDYFFADKKTMTQVKKIEYIVDQMGSDHCPVLLEI